MGTLQPVRSAYPCALLALVFLSLAAAASPVASHAAQQSPLPPTATPEEVKNYEAFRS
jgi:hypothetical protein